MRNTDSSSRYVFVSIAGPGASAEAASVPRPDTDELLWASLGRSQALVAYLEGDDLVVVSDGLRALLRDRADARAELTTLMTSAVGARAGMDAHVEASLDDGAGSTRHVAFELTVLQLEPRSRVLAVGHDVTAR